MVLLLLYFFTGFQFSTASLSLILLVVETLNSTPKSSTEIRVDERDKEMGDEKKMIYHEKQRFQFCLLHSLNNLFQDKDAFTRANLNDIAEKLVLDDPTKAHCTPLSFVFKPHHNTFTGNYDVNVLIAAVERKGKKVVWNDRRNGASKIDLDKNENKLMGIVLNVPLRKCWFLRSRHWVTLKKIEGFWYNLDSELAAPYPFKDNEEIREFIDGVANKRAEVLLVMNENAEASS